MNKHIIFLLLILFLFINFKKNSNLLNIFNILIYSFIGLLLPDIDHNGSFINKYTFFYRKISKNVKIFNHRGFTHSFFFVNISNNIKKNI